MHAFRGADWIGVGDIYIDSLWASCLQNARVQVKTSGRWAESRPSVEVTYPVSCGKVRC